MSNDIQHMYYMNFACLFPVAGREQTGQVSWQKAKKNDTLSNLTTPTKTSKNHFSLAAGLFCPLHALQAMDSFGSNVLVCVESILVGKVVEDEHAFCMKLLFCTASQEQELNKHRFKNCSHGRRGKWKDEIQTCCNQCFFLPQHLNRELHMTMHEFALLVSTLSNQFFSATTWHL